ncbi:hypothetical protein GGX14DRAFT_663194 [Mycena pura]|uniref:Uncharacterized protein n=1 Tax=Mycena pura TaxID=153505 RepID=A0AAD6YKS5_9AGAR|nr:hypothetical protein GGX14DRAFT_663194 [Mycena pura]
MEIGANLSKDVLVERLLVGRRGLFMVCRSIRRDTVESGDYGVEIPGGSHSDVSVEEILSDDSEHVIQPDSLTHFGGYKESRDDAILRFFRNPASCFLSCAGSVRRRSKRKVRTREAKGLARGSAHAACTRTLPSKWPVSVEEEPVGSVAPNWESYAFEFGIQIRLRIFHQSNLEILDRSWDTTGIFRPAEFPIIHTTWNKVSSSQMRQGSTLSSRQYLCSAAEARKPKGDSSVQSGKREAGMLDLVREWTSLSWIARVCRFCNLIRGLALGSAGAAGRRWEERGPFAAGLPRCWFKANVEWRFKDLPSKGRVDYELESPFTNDFALEMGRLDRVLQDLPVRSQCWSKMRQGSTLNYLLPSKGRVDYELESPFTNDFALEMGRLDRVLQGLPVRSQCWSKVDEFAPDWESYTFELGIEIDFQQSNLEMFMSPQSIIMELKTVPNPHYVKQTVVIEEFADDAELSAGWPVRSQCWSKVDEFAPDWESYTFELGIEIDFQQSNLEMFMSPQSIMTELKTVPNPHYVKQTVVIEEFADEARLDAELSIALERRSQGWSKVDEFAPDWESYTFELGIEIDFQQSNLEMFMSPQSIIMELKTIPNPHCVKQTVVIEELADEAGLDAELLALSIALERRRLL